ncbi:hypothetical protein HZH68_007508 [Vespula germanica]|uniref:Uncharacterized protein n=1 Tax=Vespula germanica TaxID=30212 RepID=A0A834NBU2_VESGE|nr:hypothetical protein HZH68_007508 [Vespula germanica]
MKKEIKRERNVRRESVSAQAEYNNILSRETCRRRWSESPVSRSIDPLCSASTSTSGQPVGRQKESRGVGGSSGDGGSSGGGVGGDGGGGGGGDGGGDGGGGRRREETSSTVGDRPGGKAFSKSPRDEKWMAGLPFSIRRSH